MKEFSIESHPSPHNAYENLNSGSSPPLAFHMPVLRLFHFKTLLWRKTNSSPIYICAFLCLSRILFSCFWLHHENLIIPPWELIICKRKLKINKCLIPVHSSNTYTICTKSLWTVQVVKRVAKKVNTNKEPFFLLTNTTLWKQKPLIFLSKHTGAV